MRWPKRQPVEATRQPLVNRDGGYLAASEPRTGLLAITVKRHSFGLDVSERTRRVDHVPTATELRRAERDSWFRVPKYDHVPTGRISLRLTNGKEYRTSSWTESDSRPIEEVLAELLQEVELRADWAEQQRQDHERQEAEKTRRWEAAMAQARIDLQESHRAKTLFAQLQSWRRAHELDAYLAAMAEAMKGLEDP
jgi:hypothetical protein